MQAIKVIGLDPSLNNLGIAKARILLPTFEIEIDDLVLIETENAAGKQVRKNSDDLRRGQELVRALAQHAQGSAFVISEVPTGSQSARGMFSNGICVGILAALELLQLPLIEVQPVETKKAATGRKTASKEEIIQWAVGAFPTAPWLRYKRHGVQALNAKNEHLADAVAVIKAGIATNQFRQAAALALGLQRAA